MRFKLSIKHILFTACLLIITSTAMAQYRPDVLGRPFEQLTLEQPDTYDGEVVATLVRHSLHKGSKRAVLYVHGYNDYFFQKEMAREFVNHDWQFYAVDLRRYGRSMREWQTPFDVRNLEEYFADIDAAIDQIRLEGFEEIVLVAHSTGGLITPLYCHHNRKDLKVSALILNSPFFDMNLGGGLFENAGVPVVSALGSIFKRWRVQGGKEEPGGYGRSISNKYEGEWEFDTQFKRLESLPITAGWLRAIHKGQRTLQKGLEIPCPVLVLYSDNSVMGDYSEAYMSGDSVLDVEDIATYAPCMGEQVTQIEIKGGMHDLVLSSPRVRYSVYAQIFEWLGSIK